MMTKKVEIWLEFEHCVDETPWEVFNMQLRLDDGRRYALNVWTFRFVEQLRQDLVNEGEDPLYSIGPDLLVERAERAHLERVVEKLMERGELKEEWQIVED